MDFDYDVLYQESWTIPHAYAMSYLQFQTKDELDATNGHSEVNFATCKAISLNERKAEHLPYPLIQTVMKCISGKWPDISQQETLFKKSGKLPNCRE